MSININGIKTNDSINYIPNSQDITFKTKAMPHDTVEISSKKKELSNGVKLGIGLSIVAAVGLGIYKRKSLQNFCEKIFEGKSRKYKPKSGNQKSTENVNKETEKEIKTQTSRTIVHVTDFRNINEAEEYFNSIGIKTVFKNGSEKHLADLNNIKNDLVILEKNGVVLPKPKSIIISDWHNLEEMKQIFKPLNIPEEKASICNSGTGYWGTVTKSSDNKCHVLINSSFCGNYGKFIHENGHIHQDHLNSSYWHSKGLNGKEFMQKQMDVLGLSNIHLDSTFDTPKNFISSILRYHHLPNNLPTEVKEKIYRMFSNINKDDFVKIFTIPDVNGKTYYINAKKMVDKMASESFVYAPTKTWENVAEIFQGLNKGKEYSDLVMLMYDINGGGRIPNLVIKGKKYDDYIESLYNNPDLIRQLRESIEVKELI